MTKISWLMLFKEMITVYIDNHMKHVHTKFGVADYQSRLHTY
jgi:hypothetical protein